MLSTCKLKELEGPRDGFGSPHGFHIEHNVNLAGQGLASWTFQESSRLWVPR